MKNSDQTWTRRQFVSTIGRSAAAAAFVANTKALAAVPKAQTNLKRRIALLATEARKYSHAQHFIDRILEGYGWQGRHHHPQLELAGLYMDQFNENDLSRERARRHHVKIYPTI